MWCFSYQDEMLNVIVCYTNSKSPQLKYRHDQDQRYLIKFNNKTFGVNIFEIGVHLFI